MGNLASLAIVGHRLGLGSLVANFNRPPPFFNFSQTSRHIG